MWLTSGLPAPVPGHVQGGSETSFFSCILSSSGRGPGVRPDQLSQNLKLHVGEERGRRLQRWLRHRIFFLKSSPSESNKLP